MKSSGPVHHRGKHGMPLRTRVETEFSMGRFTVHIIAQRAIRAPENIYVLEGKAAVSFHLYSGLNVLVDM
jgi:hypothetical protein